ncbi:exoribonuclease Rex4 [Schizosaccharomyces cryophilus OY26]|uniref:RNA exonuclease 4 n=1 Tax=Schizosaccharomyces cryophilus (strain OY26 / ATCC MYA-4695 / CBS 11777 / NBRC 106824 / NRRL Y48691) TaxID=653667 RepID=S9X8U5_SCHCR|nr:exoribonuclease Rex4 [Schizosaccharomyces cryophilus OY26]EPY53607.1 exoribonuclease Rex4 [Schizosaccharomyces cryophilus OY26]
MSSNWEKLRKKLDSTKSGRIEKKTGKKENLKHKKQVSNGNERASQDGLQINDTRMKELKDFAREHDLSESQVFDAYGVDAGNLTRKTNLETLGKYIAMDCEMVGVADDMSVLARVSIVNYHGRVVYDTYVRPKERVTDWRTWVSGVKSFHMRDAPPFEKVQKEVADVLENRVLVGHAIQNDLKVLLLSHPRRLIRDTSRFSGFRKLAKGKTPSLKKLAQQVLGRDIQSAQHSSVQDAQATMDLYKHVKKEMDEPYFKRGFKG